MELLLAPENFLFSLSLTLMVGIGVLEGVMTVMGLGLSSLLDHLLPDQIVPEIDVDADLAVDGDLGSPSALSRLLGWLHVGKVPLLILLVAFLMSFGVAGLVLQGAARGFLGGFLPGWIMAAPALAIALPGTRLFGSVLSRVFPSDETTAVAENDFIGLMATITLGTAAPGSPAEARLTDRHGQSHYLMLEPDLETESFGTGETVLLISRAGSVFKAIRNTSDALKSQ